MKKLILFFLLTIASYGQNQSRLTSLEIEDTPTTSVGTYDVLTRNTSTNVVEKKASNFFQTALTNPITGTGTVNYAPKFTASGVLGNSIIYDNGSSIGIGTITPSGKLHVSGFSNTTDVGQLILSEIDNPTRKLTIGVNNAANWGFLQVLVSGDNYYPFYMNPNGGNVGIGTTTDNGLDKLQVNGSISATNYTGSATLTGTPTAPTAAVGTNTTQIATTAFVQANARPYKVYTALLSQSGTSAPTATVLENTLGGTVVWTRNSTGQYFGTLSTAFVSDKTFCLTGGNTNNENIHSTTQRNNDNEIVVQSYSSGAKTDGVLNKTAIEIRVYN